MECPCSAVNNTQFEIFNYLHLTLNHDDDNDKSYDFSARKTLSNKSTLPLQLKASEALSDSNGAAVSHSRRQEGTNIPDAKQSSDTSGIKHELKNVIKSRRLAKGLDDLQLPTNSADNKPTTEEVSTQARLDHYTI